MDLDFWKLVTILVALFAAYVAYQQFRIGREKFKLNLFEKRFSVFAGARRLLSLVLTEGNIKLEYLFEFRATVGEATFLFEKDITDYLDEIDRKALRLHTLHEKLKPLPVGEKRSCLAAEISDTLGWLTDQLPALKIHFSPYMKFRAWK